MAGISLNLSQVQTQRLIMTPQMQQSIQLLQMTTMELDQLVNQELAENPFLELDEESEAGREDAPSTATIDGPDEGPAGDGEPQTAVEKLAEKTGLEVVEIRTPVDEDKPETFDDVDVNWDDYFESYQSSPRYQNLSAPDDEERDFTEYTAQGKSLYDHLNWQLRVSGLEGEEFDVGFFLINSIDDNGYLQVTVEETAQALDKPEQLIKDVLEVIQDFDPTGVGARDLQECLRLQLEEMNIRHRLLYKILDENFDLLERRRFRELAQCYQVDQKKIQEVFRFITRCDPKPGRSISKDAVQYITPDVIVKKVESPEHAGPGARPKYMYYLDESNSGMLRVNEYYRNLFQNGTRMTKEEKDYAKDKYNSAVWLIRNIEKRKSTILRVTEAIMEFQIDFLEKGIEHLKPLTLKDVAEVVGMHESTVARVTSGKYTETPRGTFELKFFFSSQLNTDGGDSTSSRSVKSIIRQIIEKEDPKRPLSDLKITKMLNDRGIQIARRTTAKYREQLRILPAKHRKQR